VKISRSVGYALGTALLCVLLLQADISGNRQAVYVFKPLAILTVIGFAAFAAPRPTARYRTLIVTALLWSLAGDVLLMLPDNLFAPGLCCFLVAHLCYISAFATHGSGRKAGFVALIPFALIAGVMLAIVWPGLGALRIPVLLYIGVIATMGWQAWGRWLQVRSSGALRAAIGALFFLVSDGTLALNRFGVPTGSAASVTIVILSTYLAAQWLIASSVGSD
jgi:alkylglycerol monooxygenase